MINSQEYKEYKEFVRDEETEEKLSPIQKKRAKLSELSRQAKRKYKFAPKSVKNKLGDSAKVNDLLKFFIYGKDTEFNTYQGWKKNGRQVKKGEKAFLFWGRPLDLDADDPKHVQNQAPENKHTEDDEESGNAFYPLSFLFAKEQTMEVKD